MVGGESIEFSGMVGDNAIGNVPSAWYLRKIESPAHKITLNYKAKDDNGNYYVEFANKLAYNSNNSSIAGGISEGNSQSAKIMLVFDLCT